MKLRVMLPLLLAGLLFVLFAPQGIGGANIYVTTHGASMEPRFHTGDLAVLRATDSYAVGDVVAYRSTTIHSVVMHRIVAVEGGRYTFKGDNNSWLDPEQPTSAGLLGTLVAQIPQGGVWLTRATSPSALGSTAFLLLASGGTAVQTRRRRKTRTLSRHTSSRHTMSRHTTPSRPGHLGQLGHLGAPLVTAPPWLRAAAAGTAALVVLGGTLAFFAWTGPVNRTTTTDSQVRRSMTFSYTAEVGQTLAYDTTTVTSPDPVFRRLAKTVDVAFTYRGAPGTVTVTADLASAGGWHSTIPLADPQTFTTTDYAATVRLDLPALEARARAAAAVTGLPAEPLTVTVRPEVATADGGTFAPTLPLNLGPLQLVLVGGEGALTVDNPTVAHQASTTARMIGTRDVSISASAARALSAVMLLVGLLAGTAIAVIASQSAPTSEGAAIRRRYSPLLVTVEPMATPKGRPVIDVMAFATLVRLSERHGLLVLHWIRSGVETFVVQDEGATYRYRASAEARHPLTGEPAPVPHFAAAPGTVDFSVPARATVELPRQQGPGHPAETVVRHTGL